MNCPICGKEMEEGGIITQSVIAMWHPLEEFQKKGLKRAVYAKGKSLGESSVLLNQTKIPNAFYCGNCDKVMGVFDVTE